MTRKEWLTGWFDAWSVVQAWRAEYAECGTASGRMLSEIDRDREALLSDLVQFINQNMDSIMKGLE